MTTNEDVAGGITSTDVFFWLGEDSVEEITEAEFETKIEAVRKAQADYLNAR